jgi:hypothetical protein
LKEPEQDLRKAFDDLFVAPYTSHTWASSRGRSHWVELEGWQDSLAGPLSSIAESGGCEFVYTRDDCYYASVSDPPSLLSRLQEWQSGLATGVERFAPATPEEAADLVYMRSVVSRMEDFVERAYSVEQSRWQAAKRA